MAKFHSLTIKDITRETKDCVSIAFEIPAELKEEFSYKQGQYLTLKINVNGEELRRSYSICSSPATGEEMRIAVKAVENGRASTYLNNGISSGQTLEVMKPMGNFYSEMQAGQKKHYVAFAAGSGITPIISLIKTALALEERSEFTLFYGNRQAESVIFKDELHQLAHSYTGRFKLYNIYSREASAEPLFKGRISEEKIKELVNEFSEIKHADEVFLCGPFDMIQSINKTLEQIGLNKEHIHYELFTSEPPAESDLEHAETVDEGDGTTPVPEAKVTVILDGEETEISMTDVDNVLDAVLDNGLDAPYACTGGSCCTCRAKLKKGKVVMDVNYALSDKEVAQGYILTCQSHPTTKEIVIDYDEA